MLGVGLVHPHFAYSLFLLMRSDVGDIATRLLQIGVVEPETQDPYTTIVVTLFQRIRKEPSLHGFEMFAEYVGRLPAARDITFVPYLLLIATKTSSLVILRHTANRMDHE